MGKSQKRGRAGRLVRQVAIAALAVIVLLTIGGAGWQASLPHDHLEVVSPGALDVDAEVTGSWTVGALTVVADDARVRIQEAGRTVWSSSPGRAFIMATTGETTWEEHRGYFWPDVEIGTQFENQSVETIRRDGEALRITGRLSAGDPGRDGRSVRYRLRIIPRGEGGAIAELSADAVDSIAWVTGRGAGSAVHGLGAQFTSFDLGGDLIPLVVREQGVGRGEQPLSLLADLTNRSAAGSEYSTYAARASFVTEDLRGFRLDPDQPASHAFAVADLRADDRVTVQSWASSMRIELTSGATPLDLITEQSAGVERPEIAGWTSAGAIVGLQGGSEQVRRKLDTLLTAGARIAGVWLQDWTGQRTTSFGQRLWWTWQLDQQRYPDWNQLVAELAARDLAVTTYVNPFLVDADAKNDDTIRNLWAEARGAGYLVTDSSGQPYLLDQGGYEASLVDLSDPQARSWFADVIAEEVLTDGVEGFMADFGEGLPFDAALAHGPAELRHNEWPRLWAETVETACHRAGKPDCVTWFRSGALGQQEHASLYWAGDQLTSWGKEDGLASARSAMLSAGVSGWPLVHSDVGGYTSIDAVVKDYTRSPELLQRWSELEAFGVLMRTHEGNRPAQNTQVYESPDIAEAFAAMTRVYAALAPYRRHVIAEAVETGVPALRHGWLVAPKSAAATVDSQFFLGADVLVAPVLSEGADTVEVTFPPGTWIHLLTGVEYRGQATRTVDAPLGTPAAFVRADSSWADPLRDAMFAR